MSEPQPVMLRTSGRRRALPERAMPITGCEMLSVPVQEPDGNSWTLHQAPA